MLPLRDENPRPSGFKPTITYALIVINVLVFFIEIGSTGQFIEFTNQNAFSLFYNWGAVPNCVTGGTVSNIDFGEGPLQVTCPVEPYISLLSSIFLHGGAMHLGGNMLFLWIFGDNIELKFGKIKYLAIYLIWGISAGLVHILGDPASVTPAIGASGAISGILGAYLVIFPKAKIQTAMMMGFFMRMMYIQARWFLPFWLVFQNLLPFFIGGFGVAGGGTAYLAHIGGFAVGLVTGYLYKKTHSSEFTYGTRYGYKA
ncbi:MAG: rhomboid family intramembrane serine protease [Nitrosarchaeum sp.]